MRRPIITAMLLVCALAWPAGTRAEVFLVAGMQCPLSALSKREATDLYTGRRQSIGQSGPLLVFDRPKHHPLRGELYLLLTGLSLAQVNSFWSRLTFTGLISPLPVVDDETVLIARLKQNPQAIGYLAQEPTDRTLKVLLVLKPEASAAPGSPP